MNHAREISFHKLDNFLTTVLKLINCCHKLVRVDVKFRKCRTNRISKMTLLPFLLLLLVAQQLGHCRSSNHCQVPRKIKAEDIVRSINQSPSSTWKASTYGFKEIDLQALARSKLAVGMDGDHTISAADMRRMKKEAKILPEGSTVPENFTWATSNRTTCPMGSIKEQSNCASGWAIATAAALSDRFCLQSNETLKTPLSHQKLLSCTPYAQGCRGGYLFDVVRYLQQNGTVTGGEYESDEGCQTYEIRPCGEFTHSMPCGQTTANTPKCKENKCNNDWYKAKSENRTYKISSYKWISAYYYEESAKQEIYNNGPLVTSFWVYPDFMLYQSGIYKHVVGYYPLGLQTVKVVGWGVSNGTKYWHVANSWGKYWGENGFFRIRRGTNECNFDWYMVALSPNTTESST